MPRLWSGFDVELSSATVITERAGVGAMRQVAAVVIAMVGLLGACKHDQDRPAASFDQLHVTVAGKPLAVTRALIKRMPAGRAQIFLANQGGSCHELLDNLFHGHDGQIDLLVTTGTWLAASGAQTQGVSDLSFHGPRALEPGTKATVGAFGAVGAEVPVTLDVKGLGTNQDAVEIHGAFTAENCGDQGPDPSGAPKAAHPSSATIEVAGKQLALAGALVRDGDLWLSAAPRDCSRWIPWAELRLDRVRDTWTLSGTWLEQDYSNRVAPDDLMRGVTVVRGAKGTSADGPTIALTLSGAGTVEGYPVAVAGTIEAIECPKSE
jgi:hypothetical protein